MPIRLRPGCALTPRAAPGYAADAREGFEYGVGGSNPDQSAPDFYSGGSPYVDPSATTVTGFDGTVGGDGSIEVLYGQTGGGGSGGKSAAKVAFKGSPAPNSRGGVHLVVHVSGAGVLKARATTSVAVAAGLAKRKHRKLVVSTKRVKVKHARSRPRAARPCPSARTRRSSSPPPSTSASTRTTDAGLVARHTPAATPRPSSHSDHAT